MLLRRVLAVPLVLALALPGAAAARGGGEREELRLAGTCSRGASSELRLRAEDGTIRVEFRVDARRARERWRLVLVHERRVAWRGAGTTSSSSRSVRIRQEIPDYEGVDAVTARASGPRGATCEATGVLTGTHPSEDD
jgi:hypothetical protein